MSVELCILASGSAGNATALRCPGGVLLIDVGIGPRTTACRLAGTGVAIGEIRAICLTHLDRDHFNPNWLKTIVTQGIRIHCHASHADELLACARAFCGGESSYVSNLAALLQPFDGTAFAPLDGLRFQSVPFQHDEAGSHGFAIDGFGCRVGYATDLGRVPEQLIELFAELDVLALESNYDPQMQLASPRPYFLKQRIMGGRGHLSNEQALEAVRRILGAAKRLPSHIVLLHRSRECNCPTLLRTLFAKDPRIAARLTLAEQNQRTDWLRPRPIPPLAGEQLALGWGL